jgi:peptidoglycan/xylan/chitin deacetylase (PgdA/CDA1 family)
MRRLVQVAICVALVWFGVLEYGGGLSGGIGHAEDTAKAGATEFAGIPAASVASVERISLTESIASTVGPEKTGLERIQSQRNQSQRNQSERTRLEETQSGKNQLAKSEDADRMAHRQKAAGLQHLPATTETIAAAAGGGNNAKLEIPDGGKTVYLTFDDGPSKHTPAVLDILKAEGIKATFFVLGENVERNPDIARRIVEEGHSIGNHTYNHVYSQLYGGFGAFADQIMKTDDAIYAAAGVRTNLVRAPGGTHGNFDQSYFDALGDAGYIVHDWNVDSGDSKRRGVPASEIVSNVKKSRLGDSLNVLLHDSSGHGELIEALPQIIAYYKGLGYAFKAIDSQLKPMQFTVASKLKWTRPAVKKMDREHLLSFAAARSVTEEYNPHPQPVKPMLYLHYGNGVLELDGASYTLENGTIQVPFDRLMAWLGGTYQQDSKSGIVEASLHGKALFWSSIQATGEQASPEGQLGMTPIRSTLGLFDMEISDYEMGKERREIWIKG